MVLGSGQQLLLQHLALEPMVSTAGLPGLGLRDAVRQFELQHVRDVLSRAGHDKREAARMLEISLASLYRKLDVDSDKRELAPGLEISLGVALPQPRHRQRAPPC